MNGDRSEANRWSAQRVPSQTLSRRKFLKVSMTGVAIAGGGGLASCMTGQQRQSLGTLSGCSKQRSPLRRVRPFPGAECMRDHCGRNQP
ncbi:MAG: twin-arginine translocation signal domain-containing protein [Mesorhizobium sp.]|nr:MAG: twin-arginine translocation signal domain-containing protein [Mesorhizobium sp.]